MTSDASVILQEVDPDKKNYEWASNSISSIRINWRQLKNSVQARENRAIMYSMQPLTEVINSFDDEDFKKNVKFDPIPVLEPLVNSVVEDMMKSPPRAEVRAEDPTALNEKKEDLRKLRLRKVLEADRTELQQRAFGPQSKYKVPYENFNGNVEEFDEMGLDEMDSDDVNFYKLNYQRLWYEIGAQSLINNILKYAQFDQETLRRLVKDIFWAKAICIQVYVDQTTGQIRPRYIDPQTCWGIFGDSNSGKDDIARGWQDQITVIDWIERVGDDFNFERDWRQLLWAINYCTNQKFTGFIRGGITYDCCNDNTWMSRIGCDGQPSNTLNWSNAYKYKVFCGYVEWRTWEATSTKITKIDDPSYIDYVPYSYVLKKKQIKEGYQKESSLQQQWYSSYFLATSSISQYLYKFQKVYYQHIEGANDEYSNGTLCYYQEEGKSAVEIAKVYLQMVNFCYYRMLWIIYKAKPDADEFVWEEMLTLAQNVRRDFPQQNANKQTPGLSDVINNMVKEMRAKHVRFRTYARVDGKPVLSIPPIEKQGTGGLDPLAIAMQAILSWAEAQIAQKIGINPMRIGANPPSRESTASENRTLELSYATTGYMYRLVQYIKEHLAITCMNYATDIIQYPDTLPYKWIEMLMGTESFEAIKSLGKISPHKFGIYVHDINTEYEKQRLMQAADISLNKGTITLSQWGVIVKSTNPSLGFKILAHLELKAKKRERTQALQDKQIELNIAKQLHDMKMEEMGFDRGTKMGVAEMEANALVMSAQIQAKGRIDVKEVQNANEIPKQEAKTRGKIEEQTNEKNLQRQEPLA